VEEALRAFSADLLIRGHEAVKGVKKHVRGKFHAVFSCRHYEISCLAGQPEVHVVKLQ